MTPLEKIRSGILEARWELVSEGFQNLTGENLTPPVKENRFPEEDYRSIAEYLETSIADAVHGVLVKYFPHDGTIINATIEVDAAGDSAGETVEAVAGEVKKKRGRPRKHPLPDPNQPKRPRGRPRKTEAGPAESLLAEAPEAKPDLEDDFSGIKEDLNREPVPRDRPPFSLVHVSCRECNREEDVHPSLAPVSTSRGDKSGYLCVNCFNKKVPR